MNKKRLTRQQAINEFCRQCIYDPSSGLGNWKQQIGACTFAECPLFPYRPQSKPKKGYVPVALRTARDETKDGT